MLYENVRCEQWELTSGGPGKHVLTDAFERIEDAAVTVAVMRRLRKVASVLCQRPAFSRW